MTEIAKNATSLRKNIKNIQLYHNKSNIQYLVLCVCGSETTNLQTCKTTKHYTLRSLGHYNYLCLSCDNFAVLLYASTTILLGRGYMNVLRVLFCYKVPQQEKWHLCAYNCFSSALLFFAYFLRLCFGDTLPSLVYTRV